MKDALIFPEQQTKRVQIKGLKRDIVVCEIDNIYGGALSIKVAKPYNLRASSYDGKRHSYKNWNDGTTIAIVYTAHPASSYNSRTADFQADAGVCEVGPHIELLYPPYQIDDFIWVSCNVSANDGDAAEDAPDQIIWLDENREGRHWKDDCGSGGGGGGSVWV